MTTHYLTTSIPYVNGAPHLGHALEFVQADLLARHLAAHGHQVRLQSGSDDHAIKNVSAAARDGVPLAEYIAGNSSRFRQVADLLGVRLDEFVATSSDPRHVPAAQTLWQACQQAGDLYRQDYTGLYCAGCEQFYTLEELDPDGLCAEHRVAPEQIVESNWFFRLSKYRDVLIEQIRSGAVQIEPAVRRNEVLGFLQGDVHDLSVSRPTSRSGGWGVPVPGDPEQTVYVWFDALANYLTGLGWPADQDGLFETFWTDPEAVQTHLVGKGIVRFHAVYWLAFLLSAGLPLPRRIWVHDYLTVNGSKIAKSGQQAADPADLIARYGQDAVRWWLLRDPARVGESDFSEQRLVEAYNRDLANGLGNLTSRALTLRQQVWTGVPLVQDPLVGKELRAEIEALPGRVEQALGRFDVPAATEAVTHLVLLANRYANAEEPWTLRKQAATGDEQAARRCQAVLAVLLAACRAAAVELLAFIPDGAAKVLAELDVVDRRPVPVFRRL